MQTRAAVSALCWAGLSAGARLPAFALLLPVTPAHQTCLIRPSKREGPSLSCLHRWSSRTWSCRACGSHEEAETFSTRCRQPYLSMMQVKQALALPQRSMPASECLLDVHVCHQPACGSCSMHKHADNGSNGMWSRQLTKQARSRDQNAASARTSSTGDSWS